MRELLPLAGSVAQVVGKIAAVTIRHGCQKPLAIFPGIEPDFRDAGKILADNIFVLGRRRAEFVKPNLLVEIEVHLRPLALVRVTGVENP